MNSIKDIILKQDISVKLTDSLVYALEIMAKNRQGVVVVISRNLPVGIITERDVLHLVNTNTDFNAPIENILKFNHIISINVKRSIDYALHVLIDNNIRRLIVIDENSNLVGIITQDILVKHLEDDTFKTNLIISSFIQNSKKLISLNKNEQISRAFDVMNKNDIGSIVAMDDNNNPVGILTERDTIRIINEKYDLNMPIKDVMSSPIVTICESHKVKDVVTVMDINDVSRVLVLKKDSNRPLFLLGARDIAHNLR